MTVTPIVALPPADQVRPRRLSCPACTELLKVEHRPRVQIKPSFPVVLASGAIIIENPVILCATCLTRGVETIL